MPSRWPMYLAHRDARCATCGGKLVDLSPTANAPGSGHYRGACFEGCTLLTWYDCAEGTVEMIQASTCPWCNHPWEQHRPTASGARSCTHYACGCQETP